MFRYVRSTIKYPSNHFYIVNKYFTTSNDVNNETPILKRIFSGIQPTGAIHLGNYLGAITQWVRLQEENENVILSIADLHSMTITHDPKQLSSNILQITATLLSCGIDPNKVILFQQSAIQTHTELCWYLGCISTMARLAHLPQYKEKSKNIRDIPLGLFIYPVLQAADILAYKSTHVPVGEDQVQQIQLTQELARMFNNRFGNTFPIPHTILTDTQYARLRSLRDPIKKMSKSDSNAKSRICLTDKPDDIVRNIKKAVTDFISEVTYDPENRPGVSNLINIHSFIMNKSIEDICKDSEHLNTGQYKLLVADAVVNYMKPIQEKISYYLSDEQYLLDLLRTGGEKASEISEKTLEEVRYKLGLNIKVKAKKKVEIYT